MKKIFISFFIICSILATNGQVVPQIEYFHLQDVKLLDSPFKKAQELDKKYLLEMDADRLSAPFLREAGLTPKAESYTNWENTGLDGHIGGHYLSALSLMYASTGDQYIKERLDYMLDELKKAQDANANGYLGGVPGGKAMWNEIAQGNIRAGGFDLNGKWVPLYNIHKTYAGLRDAYLYADSEQAKEMLIKMTDWMIDVVAGLTEEQIQDMLRSEHGGLNETFADVAVITGQEKYMKLARQFSHRHILDPLLVHEDKLTGMHANTQIPKVLGFKRIADATGDEQWSDASRFFWETVIRNRSVCIGGNSVGEHFNPTDDFSRVIRSIEGPETCNTYNMLRLTKMFYQTSPEESYIEYYERALYNHILSTQHPEKGGFVYFTQMRPGHYRVYSQPQTSMWCCVGSGIENHAKYGEMIYAHTKDELFVNLFIPSTLNWQEKDTEIIQENNFPEEAGTTLILNPKRASKFTLQLRYPAWVETGKLTIWINGKKYDFAGQPGSYIPVSRKWKKGDKIEIEMPMHVAVEQLPDKSNYFAFFYGPIVLSAKTGTEDLKGLFADDSRGGHIAHGKQVPLKDMPIVVGETEDLAGLLTAVPNKPLTFHLGSLYPEKYAKGFDLIPFYKVHDSRYIIYWPQATANGVKKIQQQIEQEEQERLRLDGLTIDKIVCGEQQPESDHFIQYDQSWTGFTEGLHWRDAKGWFSYQLKNKDKNAGSLHLQHFNSYWKRGVDIYINDTKVTSITTEKRADEELMTAVFDIPESEKGKEVLNIKFVAQPKVTTPRIAEIRLLK